MNEDFRKSAPAPLAPVAFNIPQPFETTLANGLKLVIFEDKKLPLVSFRLIFRAGDIHEPADSVGLNSAVASMLSEGTESYSSKQLAEEIERLGASLSASSGSDTTSLSASSLTLYASDILRLMAEMILKPTFPEEELDLYRRNTIEGLKFQRSQANFLADEQVSRIIYGNHPYAKVSPKAEDVEKITREKLIEHQARTFIPNNAVFVIVGDVDKDDLIAEIEDKFGEWESGEVADFAFDAVPRRSEKTLTIVDRKGSAQSNIVLANPAVERNHPDYFRSLLMNQILGAGASSRIFMNLREEKGYTYGAYSKFDLRRLAGAFEATAEVRTAVTGDSLKEFFYELNRIRDEKVSEEELQDAKNFLAGVFPIRAETQEGLTSLIVQQQIYDLPADYLETYRDKVNEVTIEDVAAAAQQYVQPEQMAIVIVGDAEDILPQVKEYAAAIEIFDTEGNLQDISNYGKTTEAPTIELTGNWDLTIDFQGQKLPVSLTLEQTDGKVSGKLDSMLGEGKIENGKVAGNSLSAVAILETQGQAFEISINGSVENEEITGTLSGPQLPHTYNFSGRKR
ncbi:MAG TPA: pitrilysin family protein [Pyrinomonadaceae bacterium]|nr:pitrilysin family protein [Pyrinomonadaceae bacterium]